MKPTINDVFLLLGKVMGELKGVNKRLDTVNGTLTDHGKRINTNESKIDVNMGKVSVISALFGFVGACIIAFIGFFNN